MMKAGVPCEVGCGRIVSKVYDRPFVCRECWAEAYSRTPVGVDTTVELQEMRRLTEKRST